MNAIIMPMRNPDKTELEAVLVSAAQDNFITIVIDDGSGSRYAEKFAALPDSVLLITHEFWRGFGRCVKDALQLIEERNLPCDVIATVNRADRYRTEDIRRACEAVEQGNRAYACGIPEKREKGFRSKLEPVLFSMAAGKKIASIHSGLRAFARSELDRFRNVRGNAREYEIESLIAASRAGLKIIELPVQIERPEETGDYWKKNRSLYLCAALFLLSSLFAFGLEFLLLMGIRALCEGPFGEEAALLIAVVLSRVISCLVNYVVNKKLVFDSHAAVGGSLLRYIIAAAAVLGINYLLLRFCVMVLHWKLTVAKLIVESALFFLNFFLQSKYVYKE